MEKEIEEEIQANENKNNVQCINDSSKYVITMTSMRVTKMFLYSISIVVFLLAIVFFIFKSYILGSVFVIVGIYCFVIMHKTINKFKEEIKNRDVNMAEKSLKEDLKELGGIFKNICKYISKNLFKVLGIMVMVYVAILFMVGAIMMILTSL